MGTTMDLAEYLRPDVEAGSLRSVARKIGISKSALENIVKRRLKTMPELTTLEKIAEHYGLTLSAVVGMVSEQMGDDRYAQLARQLDLHPWITERFDELTSMSKEEFEETMDYIAYRRQKNHPPRQDDDQSIP